VSEAERAAVLAIDGGGSKTDVALVARDGRVLATATGPGSNIDFIGRDQVASVLASLVRELATAAGLATDGLVAAHTSACLAGADLPEEEAELGELIQAQGWSVTSSVVNDTFAVLRAGLHDAGEAGGAGGQRHWGIGVVCGAGINCVGVAPDGRTTRFLALGQISGDWGGGGDLGPEALWWAIRAEDGRGPQTELRAAVPAHFGVDRVEDVVLGLHLGQISYDQLHGLVPVLYKVAGNGDEVAGSVVLRLADEISRMATVAATRLGLGGRARRQAAGLDRRRASRGDDPPNPPHASRGDDPPHRPEDARYPVPVVLGGSLLTARDPLLTGAIRGQLAKTIPGADVRIAEVPPIAGAALLGLDHVGAPPAAAARLRESAAATW
jgi:N-acetylglucosamine kinase-like BadF-type ATPase